MTYLEMHAVMATARKRNSATFEAKVALEAAKQTGIVAKLAKLYKVHPVQTRNDIRTTPSWVS